MPSCAAWCSCGRNSLIPACAWAVLVAVSATDNWHAVGQFFTTATALALTGVLAAVAALMGAGGFTTLRRVTI
jgi:hypothetical protein